ncbi:MAG TPA: sugar ABC transporter ATP-binding protein [Acidimicrobiales bacterium]|nr:sugar ABC transporter ATP-binding protein [Acidimicrobiales bacterium]
MTAAAVEIERLSKTFSGQRALVDVSLTISAGEVHGLLGENGSGKSTLIKILSGFHSPNSGAAVAIYGQQLKFGSAAESARLGLRFVHQNLGIIKQMSAVENVAMTSGFNVRPGFPIRLTQQAKRVQALFDRFGADVDLWTPLGKCRAIDRTIVAIVRALDGLEENGVLVLDEPTAALPPEEVEHLFETVREVTKRGVTTLYVSHRLDEVFQIVNRVSVLRDGVLQGTRKIGELDKRELVRMIVGSLPARFDDHAAQSEPRDASNRAGDGPPRLRVQGLRSGTVKHADLEIASGEIVGVAGLIGSGRDELARALIAAVPSRTDGLWLDGKPITGRMTPRRARSMGLGYVPGNRGEGSAVALFDVRENITLTNLRSVSDAGRLSRAKETRRAIDWIRDLDIRPPDPNRRFSLLSGGNQQKTVLAKWFNIAPRLMLVDDPTAGVDVGARHAIYDLIRAKAGEGVSFLVCSTDNEDLVELCPRVLVMRDGLIAAELRDTAITYEKLLMEDDQ